MLKSTAPIVHSLARSLAHTQPDAQTRARAHSLLDLPPRPQMILARSTTRLLRRLLPILLLCAIAWRHVLVAAQTTTTTDSNNNNNTSATQATAWLSSRTGGSLRFEWCVESHGSLLPLNSRNMFMFMLVLVPSSRLRLRLCLCLCLYLCLYLCLCLRLRLHLRLRLRLRSLTPPYAGIHSHMLSRARVSCATTTIDHCQGDLVQLDCSQQCERHCLVPRLPERDASGHDVRVRARLQSLWPHKQHRVQFPSQGDARSRLKCSTARVKHRSGHDGQPVESSTARRADCD